MAIQKAANTNINFTVKFGHNDQRKQDDILQHFSHNFLS